MTKFTSDRHLENKQHKRAVFTGDKNSLLAQYCMQNSYEFNLDVKIVHRQWPRRLFLEAWRSIREPNSVDEQTHIPDKYKALANP